MRAENARPVQPAEVIERGLPAFVDRDNEARRLDGAIRKRTSLVIFGPAGMGKTALVRQVIHRLPPDLAASCLYIPGMKDLPDLLRQLVRRLHDLEDPHLRRDLHSVGISALTFEPWLKEQSSSHLKGVMYRTLEQGDYRVFLDHVPHLTHAVAQVIKELFWMRNAPVYLMVRDELEQHLQPFYRSFYWGDRERLALPALPAAAAEELLENCIKRLNISRLDLTGFRDAVLKLSKRVPGAIVKMCALAADPRFQYGSRVMIRSIYINYLMNGHELEQKPTFPPTLHR